jgi:hypothetical protein
MGDGYAGQELFVKVMVEELVVSTQYSVVGCGVAAATFLLLAKCKFILK